MASGLYVVTFRGVLGNLQTAIDFDADTHKCALHTDVLVPNYSSDDLWSNGALTYDTTEVTDGDYTTGGATLTGTSLTESPAGTLMFDSTLNPTWTPVTFTARFAVIYADAQSNELLCAVDFGQNYTATEGTFTVTWNGSGIFTIDLTP